MTDPALKKTTNRAHPPQSSTPVCTQCEQCSMCLFTTARTWPGTELFARTVQGGGPCAAQLWLCAQWQCSGKEKSNTVSSRVVLLAQCQGNVKAAEAQSLLCPKQQLKISGALDTLFPASSGSRCPVGLKSAEMNVRWDQHNTSLSFYTGFKPSCNVEAFWIPIHLGGHLMKKVKESLIDEKDIWL